MLWDPLRRKEVADTPEENVRQWFISVLKDRAGVPLHQMMSEVSFMFGRKSYRADVIVYDKSQKPLAVVECKRPDVALDAGVSEQAMRYNAVLDVRFIFLTNGLQNYAFKRLGGTFVPLTEMPDYQTMLQCQR